MNKQQTKSMAELPVLGAQTMQQSVYASQSSVKLVTEASPDSLGNKLASLTAPPVPRMPVPPKLEDFAMSGHEGSPQEVEGNDPNLNDISTIHNEELENLNAVDSELISGSLTDYQFANKEPSEEGQKGFMTSDYSRSRENGPEYHSPIDVEERYEEVVEVSAEAREEQRQEDALNAECDALTSPGGKVGCKQFSKHGQAPKHGDLYRTNQSARPGSWGPGSWGPSSVGQGAFAQDNTKSTENDPSNLKASTGVAAAYLNRIQQDADYDTQQASYDGDYSIGVNLPSFNLPEETSGTKYSKRLLEQWVAEDTNSSD